MSKSVFCLVANQEQASSVLMNLQTDGFAGSEISVLYPRKGDMPDAAPENATKAPEGMATGAASGGLAGGLVGLLSGIGALAIPGLGAFVAAGPILAVLEGAAIGAMAGGMFGGLVGLGLPAEDAERYHERIQQGYFLISVRVDSDEEETKVVRIFETAGGEDIRTVKQATTALVGELG